MNDETVLKLCDELGLDVIALCCDFVRYDSLDQYNDYHNDCAEDVYDIEALACMIDDTAFITYAH